MPLRFRRSLALIFLIAFWLVGCQEQARENRSHSEPYDLARDEQLGGHTLSRHVGRTDEELRERLEKEPHISAASTYTDRQTAERVVAEAIERSQHKADALSGYHVLTSYPECAE